MVNNYDRIYTEIKSEAERLASEHNVDRDALVSLVMEIVDLEDRDRIRHIHNIRQQVEERILATAVRQMQTEES